MKWQVVVPVSILALATVAGAAVGAVRHARTGGHGRGGMCDPAAIEQRIANRLTHVMEELDATENQKEQARRILRKYAPDLKALRERHEATRAEVLGLWGGGSLDAADLRAVIDRKLEEARAAGYKLADAVAELHGILTPEQRSRLAGMIEERHGWRCGGR